MILGHVRDYLPRVTLALPGLHGPLNVKFIVDTGFQCDLSLPSFLVAQLDTVYMTDRIVRFADGTRSIRPYHEMSLDWDGEEREVEITVLENNPLLGAILMDGFSLHVDMVDGGEVVIERM